MGIIENSLHQAETALHEFISGPADARADGKRRSQFLNRRSIKGCKIIGCGNGSLCDAAHFAERADRAFRGDRRPLPAMAINDAAYMTCVGNDFSFDQIFARWVEAFGREGDVLLAISTSGNSGNVVMAIEKAKACGMKVVALTAKGGNKLSELADVAICAPRTPPPTASRRSISK